MLIELCAVAIGAGLALLGVHHATPAPTRPAGRPRPPARPDQLEHVERALELASTAGDLHVGLRPLLRAVAAQRLRSRGIELDRQPDAARAALGAELWDVVRPGRPPPPDGFVPGVTTAEIDAMLARLEAL